MNPTPQQLAEIQSLYDAGQLLVAHAAVAAIAPLGQWRGAAGRVLAGRLAMNLGGPQLGRTLHMLAWREHPEDPAARYYYARALLERRGPLPAWEFLQRHGDLPDAPPIQRGDWLSFYSQIAGMLRDFQTAEHWLALAEKAAPEHLWVFIERADLLERQDCYQDALAVIQRALELRPWYRPAVQHAAHLLQLLDRDEEALEVLRQAAGQIQSCAVVMQLAQLETELRQFEAARQSWERALELCPLAEKALVQWLAGRRSDAAYYCGDTVQAAQLAREAKNSFHEKIAEKLSQTNGPGRRVMLPVGFVRQHHMTCAPATLSAISRFWSVKADHLALAEAICYDGTPSHSERNWAQMNGFAAREFRVDWPSAAALIDAGIPFTFTTMHATNSHLQAVIGYDSLRGTLLIRDPYERSSGEFIGDATFELFRSSGPRGMALTPIDRSADLESIPLPDAQLYDKLHEVQRALADHDRPRASLACDQIDAAAPNHRLSLWARRSLASYDSNTAQSLACIDKLLELYPGDANLRLARLSRLRLIGRREDRLALLETICNEKGADPIFREHYARELRADARQLPKAVRMLRRALRIRRVEASIYHALGDACWEQRKLAEALQLYRFAACIDDKDEGLARTWFVASRHLKQTDQVLAQMRDRFARFARRSSQPARTLFWAYEQIDRPEEGYRVLAEALALRPEDGELLAFAASAHARHGRLERAGELLAAAKGRSHPAGWLRTAAAVANYRGETPEALELWRQVLAADPLAMDAHRQLAQLLAETEGRAAALAHLEQAAGRFPHNYPIHQLWIEWLREEGAAAIEPVVAKLIEIHPADGWARREHVQPLLSVGRLEEAAAEAQMALRLDPTSPSSHFFHGLVLAREQNLPEARAAFRRAIALSVDADYAISNLISACDTPAQRREELAFVQQELVKQTIFGDGLLAYREHTQDTLDAQSLLESLREALAVRPDLWHAWSAVIHQLTDMGQTDEAHRLALEATARFGLLPRLWLDLASVCRARNDDAGEKAALQQALEINPTWGDAVRRLADAHERAGEVQRGCELLEAAVARSPLDAAVQGRLAQLLWALGRRDEALERAARAVRLEPGLQWAWDALRNWANELKKPQFAVDLARELTVRRAGEARSWLVLARMLTTKEQVDERLAALDRALTLNPRTIEGHDQRAWVLANAGRFDEALAACRPAIWGDSPPHRLRGRAAWILAERGNFPAAIAAMLPVVAEEPQYYWGLCQLCDWYRHTRANADYLSTARLIHQRWPLDVIGHGYLAEALVRTNDKPAARVLIRSAVRSDPDYTFGANLLFDLSLETGDADEAATALQHLNRCAPGLATATRAVKLAAARGNVEDAAQTLAKVLRDPRLEQWSVDAAYECFKKNQWLPRLEHILRDDLARESAHPIVGTSLMTLLAEQKRWLGCQWLAEDTLTSVGPPRRRWPWRAGKKAEVASPSEAFQKSIATAYLDVLGNNRLSKTLARFLRRHRRWLRKDTFIWGKVSFALKSCRQNRQIVQWMADWRERKDVQSWMLINLAHANRALGWDGPAHAVHVEAVKLAAEPRHRSIHHLWLAFDALRAGNAAAAEAALKQVDMTAVGDLHRVLRGLVDALLAVSKSHAKNLSSHQRREQITLARQAVENGVKSLPKFHQDTEYRRAYRHTIWAIAVARPTPGNVFWYFRRKKP